jgi:mercuric ion transport protein
MGMTRSAGSTIRWREALTGITPVAVLGTTVCCALPITLVSLGLGSVVASLVGSAPWLVALSQHKEWVFLLAGVLLLANYWALYRAGGIVCEPGGFCDPARAGGRWLRRVFWSATGLYGVAVFAAYLSVPVSRALAG